MTRDEKMVVKNHRGIFYYPYTQLKSKKVFYDTKVYPSNGLKERQRRIKQMLKDGAKK